MFVHKYNIDIFSECYAKTEIFHSSARSLKFYYILLYNSTIW